MKQAAQAIIILLIGVWVFATVLYTSWIGTLAHFCVSILKIVLVHGIVIGIHIPRVQIHV